MSECTWLVERRRVIIETPEMLADPDYEPWYPDFPSDLVETVECGAPVGQHPDYPGVEGATLCDAGHDRLPYEIEHAPGGPAWQRETHERR